MSHFTHIKTRFQNLFYLKKTLNKLKILFTEQESNHYAELKTDSKNLIIPQPNQHDIEFKWNGQEYELIADISFWNQPCTVTSFIDKISQQYASVVIIGESQKTGFHTTELQQNDDGSNILILERWNDNH